MVFAKVKENIGALFLPKKLEYEPELLDREILGLARAPTEPVP